ncbi:glycosyl transferase, partial [Romboutsia weinsteinii]
IGMIGSCGCKDLSSDGIWWNSKHQLGKVYFNLSNDNVYLLDCYKNIIENSLSYDEACCLDGFIMITQYDVFWREDIFDAWHFYDASQSMEFINKGYKIVIPKQYEPWYIHLGESSSSNYEDYRLKFLNTYSSTIKMFESI